MCEINICYSGLLYVLSVSAWVPPAVQNHECKLNDDSNLTVGMNPSMNGCLSVSNLALR